MNKINNGKTAESMFERIMPLYLRKQCNADEVMVERLLDRSDMVGAKEQKKTCLCDYIVVYNARSRYSGLNEGRVIFYEVKSIQSGDMFPLSNIKPTQHEKMSMLHAAGGDVRLCIFFLESGNVYEVPYFLLMSIANGKKSVIELDLTCGKIANTNTGET